MARTLIQTQDLTDSIITNPKLGLLAVDTGNLSDSAVTNSKLASLSVSQLKIANAAVGLTQLEDGAVANSKMAVNAIADANIIDATITYPKLAAGIYLGILSNKKVTSYVQNNLFAVGAGLTQTEVTSIIGITNVPTSSYGTAEGIFVDEPNNFVPVRDSDTGEPIVAYNSVIGLTDELFGRLTFGPTPGLTQWFLNFYIQPTGLTQTSTAIPNGTTQVDWQYLQRFNLATVDESFASSTKFFNGAVDVTEILNITQLANDIYTTPVLNNNGLPILLVPLETQIDNIVSGVTGLSITLGAGVAVTKIIANGITYTDTVNLVGGCNVVLDTTVPTVITINSSGGGGGGFAANNREEYIVGTPTMYYTGSLTLFNLATAYVNDNLNLNVYYDGVLMRPGYDYTETTTQSFTFLTPRVVGRSVSVIFKTSSASDAQTVGGYGISSTPLANHLLPLNGLTQFPSSVIPAITNIAAGAVGLTQLEDQSVTTAKIRDLNVTTIKITDANVTQAKLATGAVGITQLESQAVTNAKLATSAVTANKIASGHVVKTIAPLGGLTITDDVSIEGRFNVNVSLSGSTIRVNAAGKTVSASDPTSFTGDAGLTSTFILNLGSNVTTINGPTNGVDGQKITYRLVQDGSGSRTVTWSTGSGNFKFGTDLPSITLSTAINAVDYVGAIYNLANNVWDIIALVKGF
jgi:hypothetical protein